MPLKQRLCFSEQKTKENVNVDVMLGKSKIEIVGHAKSPNLACITGVLTRLHSYIPTNVKVMI